MLGRPGSEAPDELIHVSRTELGNTPYRWMPRWPHPKLVLLVVLFNTPQYPTTRLSASSWFEQQTSRSTDVVIV